MRNRATFDIIATGSESCCGPDATAASAAPWDMASGEDPWQWAERTGVPEVVQLEAFAETLGVDFKRDMSALPSAATFVATFSKALNRSVTGLMNDLIYHAKMWLTEGDLSPHETSFKLNKIPMSALDYSTPKVALKSLGREQNASD